VVPPLGRIEQGRCINRSVALVPAGSSPMTVGEGLFPQCGGLAEQTYVCTPRCTCWLHLVHMDRGWGSSVAVTTESHAKLDTAAAKSDDGRASGLTSDMWPVMEIVPIGWLDEEQMGSLSRARASIVQVVMAGAETRQRRSLSRPPPPKTFTFISEKGGSC